MPPDPSLNIEIQMYYQDESKFNGVYSQDNLPKSIKDGKYVINRDEYADAGTYCIALYVLLELLIFNQGISIPVLYSSKTPS